MTTTAEQGHIYSHGKARVVALESGEIIKVRELDPDGPLGFGQAYMVNAKFLEPLGMKYFGGQIPNGAL